MRKLKSSKIFNRIFAYFTIVFGAFLIALATYMFTIPAKFIPGGVTGIASMTEILSGFHASYTIAILNVPILIGAFIALERRFAIRTFFGLLSLTGFLELFKAVNMYTFTNTSNPLITALVAGCLSGIGTGLLLTSSGSPGGTEALGMLIQKKLKHVKFAYILLVLNVIVITIGAIMYFFVGSMSIDEILVIGVSSILQCFINSKSIDLIVNGINSAVKFEVITHKGKELSEALNKRLEFGVTIIESQGAYSEEKSDLLICVVPKTYISIFKEVVAQNDPNAFVFSINTREVMGKNFKQNL